MNPEGVCSDSDEDEDFDLDVESFGGEARGGAMATAEPSTVPKRRAADAGLLTGRSDEEEGSDDISDDPYSSGDEIIAAYRARPKASPPTTTASTDVAQTTSPELNHLAHIAFAQAAWAPDTLGMKAKVVGEGERIEDMQLRTAGNFSPIRANTFNFRATFGNGVQGAMLAILGALSVLQAFLCGKYS